jgi:HD-like signal output (HDOD) protein
LDEVVREVAYLPSAPRVLPRLKRLLRDGNSSRDEVVAMIRWDPGIAARVLQFGNSAYFSHGLRCYTVEEAVQRVGYEQIYELVATAVASEVLVRPLNCYGIDADELWSNSLTCALAAESLAKFAKAEADIAYTIGLLHHIGMVVIDEWVSRNQPMLRFSARALPLEACESERTELGFHQAEAGACLLRTWDFPPAMTEPVRWQYLPNCTASHFHLSALLHAAKWIRSQVLHPENPRGRPPTGIITHLGLSNSQFDRLVPEVAAKFSRINIELTDSASTISLQFPGGNRLIPQR